MAEKIYGIFSPVLGLKNDFPTILLPEGYVMTETPDTKDVLFRHGKIQAAKKRLKAWDQALPDPILHDVEYRKKDNTKYEMVCTKRDVARRDDSNDRLVYLTQKYAVGKVLLTNLSDKVYGGLEVDNCDDNPVVWADGSGGDVTPSRDTTSPKDGTAFVRLTVADSAGVELLAYHNITSVDLSAYDSVGFWIRSSVNTTAGDLQFLMDDTAACASPLETLNIPALTANTWTWVNLTLADPSLLTAVVSIGIKQAVDKGACTIDIDQIVAGDWAGQLKAGDFITFGGTITYTTDDTWYEVETVDSDTQITLTAVFAGVTASQQSYQARITYAGANSDYWQSIVFDDKWIATNRGIDNVQVWDSTGVCSDLSADCPKARYITSYENYVILGFIIDGSGNSFPQTYQWCALGDETNWTTGDSGENSISDPVIMNGFSPGTIEGYKVIGTSGGIYRIHLVSGDEVFKLENITMDIGINSPYSMVNFNRGVYAFCSDFTFRKITISSWDVVSANADEILKTISFQYKQNIQGVFNVEYGLLMWLIPNSSCAGVLNQILTLDVSSGAWGTISHTGYCFGVSTPETTYTWDTLPYATWQSWDWEQWDTFVQTSGFVMTNISDANGYLFRMFSSELDDGGNYVRSFVLGTDCASQQGIAKLKRLLKVEAFFDSESTGTKTISLQVKPDKKLSWIDAQDPTPQSIINTDNEFTFVTFYFDSVPLARHFMFKYFAENAYKFVAMLIYFDDGYGNR